jgi:hypothetical protein
MAIGAKPAGARTVRRAHDDDQEEGSHMISVTCPAVIEYPPGDIVSNPFTAKPLGAIA